MDKLRDRRISLIYMEILRFAQNDTLLVQVFQQSLSVNRIIPYELRHQCEALIQANEEFVSQHLTWSRR